MSVLVKLVDYLDDDQAKALASLLNAYATDAMGGGKPLDDWVVDNISIALSKIPHAFSIMGYIDTKPAGLINCFEGFSTFSCKPLINIHDIIVLKEFRGNGLGHIMLKKVEEIAIRKGCCKLTLEVLSGNEIAKLMYRKFGFSDYELDPKIGEALFWQKPLINQ